MHIDAVDIPGGTSNACMGDILGSISRACMHMANILDGIRRACMHMANILDGIRRTFQAAV